MVVVLGRVVVDVELVEEEVVVVVSGIVVVVVVVVLVVVVEVVVVVVVVVVAVWVNAESGTMTQPVLLIFHASIRQVAPPFSYIHTVKALLPA